jgi:hypothetical protein
MKKVKHDTSPTAMTMTMSKVTDMDYEAAGQLSSTDLHLIIATAVEGHDKRCLAYHALTNNYTSLMCSSNPKKTNS